MSSLYIVGYGKEQMHSFIAYLKNELKDFITHKSASFYNLKYDKDFFDAFVPIDIKKTYQHTFPHLSTIENWSRIY